MEGFSIFDDNFSEFDDLNILNNYNLKNYINNKFF